MVELNVPLSVFTPAVREWFERAFEAPTPVQEQAWPAIATGEHVLISAPTGSGKTLAAFLWGLDHLIGEPDAGPNPRHQVGQPLIGEARVKVDAGQQQHQREQQPAQPVHPPRLASTPLSRRWGRRRQIHRSRLGRC